MVEALKGWQGSVIIDNTEYKSVSDIPSDLRFTDNSIIILKSNIECSSDEEAKPATQEYKITVRQYMTRPSTPEFDFMAKWNNDVPMPLMIMQGTIIKETPGMYKMKLHGNISGDREFHCMKCGREITNPVSQYFGMGPECGGHNYVSPFQSESELKEAIANYKKYVQSITWEGWVIKSAITHMEEI